MELAEGRRPRSNSSSPMGDATRSFIVTPAFSRERLLSWQIGISIGHFQFTASYTDGTIVLSENVEFSANDGALLQKHFSATWRRCPKGHWSADPDPTTRFGNGFQTKALAESFVSASPVAQSAGRKRP